MAEYVADYDYALPAHLIAQYPAAVRGGGRLLHLSDSVVIRRFAALPGLLRRGDLLVVNNTRVLPARLTGHKTADNRRGGNNTEGAKAEILAERFYDNGEMLAQVKCGGALKPGMTITAGGVFVFLRRQGEFCRLRAVGKDGKAVEARRRFLRHGQTPLPPYIRRAADNEDSGRYQTLFARTAAASAAAPTAGLHFDNALLRAVKNRGITIAPITLHIGAGTFKPLRHKQLAKCKLHSEQYDIGKKTAAAIGKTKKQGGRIVAIGTTTLRALEASALQNGGEVCAGGGETDLFIRPGFAFRTADLLLTNFHLPHSSLLVLVCAFGGRARVLDAYRRAAAAQMRFFSYGDAMLLDRRQ
ncbi:MAG: tRNA preQ1(34) S-adenosylmethionine ribosyltransferase-isomerase QueA [Gammaproteobacteria bacterium]